MRTTGAVGHRGRSGAVLFAVVVGAALMGAPLPQPARGAPAAAVTRVEPASAYNNSVAVLKVRTTTPFPPDPRLVTVEFVHAASGFVAFSGVLACGVTVAPGPIASPSPSASIGSCTAPGELNVRVQLGWSDLRESYAVPPGPYDVHVRFVYAPRSTGDSCSACFTVVHAGGVAVTAVTPGRLARRTSGGPVTIEGYNFAADAVVEAVFAGTNRVDPAIRFTPWRPHFGPWPRSQSLQRAYTVDAGADVGGRDIRVRIPSGGTGRLRGALRIVARL